MGAEPKSHADELVSRRKGDTLRTLRLCVLGGSPHNAAYTHFDGTHEIAARREWAERMVLGTKKRNTDDGVEVVSVLL